MAEKEKKRVVRILSESGTTMMALEALGRDGDRLVIQGSMVASWPCKMYVDLEDVLKMIKMMINREVISYIVSLPFLVLKRGSGKTE